MSEAIVSSNNLHLLDHLPTPPEDGVLIVPLGGCGMVGMNATLLGTSKGWILIDCGIGLGVTDIVPFDAEIIDPSVIEALGDRLVACVITHGHEDHVGGILSLWPWMRCPIIAPRYAAATLNIRLKREGIRDEVLLTSYIPGDTILDGMIRTIPMTHSVPDCAMLVVETPAGRIVFSGDWKLDPHVGFGLGTDIEALRSLGDEGIRLFVCESTNAAVDGRAGGEVEVAEALQRVCEQTPGMVVVATFGSHLSRVATAATAGLATGRHIGLLGYALSVAAKAGQACGFVEDVSAFLTPVDLSRVARGKRMLITTGAQGEPNAGLGKLLSGKLPDDAILLVGSGDALVMSARTVPGNEQAVAHACQTAMRTGMKIWTPRMDSVHVSGHACRDEFRLIYEMLRPELLLPYHGAPEHLGAHEEFATSCGVKVLSQKGDGTIYHVTRERAEPIGVLMLNRWGVLNDKRTGRRLVRRVNDPSLALVSELHAPQPALLMM